MCPLAKLILSSRLLLVIMEIALDLLFLFWRGLHPAALGVFPLILLKVRAGIVGLSFDHPGLQRHWGSSDFLGHVVT